MPMQRHAYSLALWFVPPPLSLFDRALIPASVSAGYAAAGCVPPAAYSRPQLDSLYSNGWDMQPTAKISATRLNIPPCLFSRPVFVPPPFSLFDGALIPRLQY